MAYDFAVDEGTPSICRASFGYQLPRAGSRRLIHQAVNCLLNSTSYVGRQRFEVTDGRWDEAGMSTPSAPRSVLAGVRLPSEIVPRLMQIALDREVVVQVRQHFLVTQDAHRDPAALRVETHKTSIDFNGSNGFLAGLRCLHVCLSGYYTPAKQKGRDRSRPFGLKAVNC